MMMNQNSMPYFYQYDQLILDDDDILNLLNVMENEQQPKWILFNELKIKKIKF